MNTTSGNDPMLSSFINDDWGKFTVTSSSSVIPLSSAVTAFSQSSAFIISMDGLLGPEAHSALSPVWSNDRKCVMTSIKTEDDERFLMSPYAPSAEMDSSDIDMEEINIGKHTTVADIKSEIEDSEFDDIHAAENSLGSQECNSEYNTSMVSTTLNIHFCIQEANTLQMSEATARKYVEEQFEKIAFVPSSKLSHKEKIEFILAQSDCSEYSTENVLSFDKRSPDSARACARIVQNIPQRYRWECVIPEDIPCCYTIVADCKKVSSRDKPPRPMNAFMIWAQGARRLINELCPKMQNALISEALGYYWRQKSDAFKKNFEQEKIKLRRFHNVEFPEYKYKPKTKIQKAKEKQELSLTKAKMRAFVKQEKIHLTEDLTSSHKRTKSVRPRKVKQVSVRKEMNKSHVVICEQSVGTSSTKPDIKDMLTLKILADRRSKAVNKTNADLNVCVNSAFGQLSPLEIGSPYGSDVFNDRGNFQISLVGHIDRDNGSSSVQVRDNGSCSSSSSVQVIPSSVYDTPANTPPVDVDDELLLSPTHPAASSAPLMTAVSKESALYKASSLSTNTSNSNTSLSALLPTVQILSNKMVSVTRSDQRGSLGDPFSKFTTFSTTLQPANVSRNLTTEFSDLLFTYVTEALSSSPMNSRYINSRTDMHSTVSNNNMGIISASDDNNNNIDTTPIYSTGVSNSKTVNCSNGEQANDLDTLRLDLNCPILTDDDMRSLLNTL